MEVESHEDDKNCSVCESEVGDGDHAMGCQWCGLWTHRKCLKPKMSEAEYKAISNSKNDNMMYFCTKCQPMVGITLRFFNEVRMKQASMNERLMSVENSIENISRTITQTETDVAAVKENVEQISEKIGAVESTMDRVIDLKLDDMKDEEKERERRQNNVILYNVPEKVEGKNDKTIVEEILKHDLGVKDVKIEDVFRLGVGKEPRPILLKVKDAQTQKVVLSKAKNLKQADTEISRNIYIVSDKTPRERERYRELQKELKERKDKGETDLMIRDMKVVKRREGRQKGTDGKEVRNRGQENETGATGSSQRRSYSHVLVPPNGQKQ